MLLGLYWRSILSDFRDKVRRKLGKPTGEIEVMHEDCGQILESESIRSITDSKPVGLKPPPLPKIDISFDDLDYDEIARSSEFRRFVYYIYTGKTHRGTLKKLDIDIKAHKEVSQIVTKLQRGSPQDFRECMKELEEKLKARRERLK